MGGVILDTSMSSFAQQGSGDFEHHSLVDASQPFILQVQFFAKGPSGHARVSAEMYLDDSKQWQYSFLYMDLEHPVPTRVTLIEPRYY